MGRVATCREVFYALQQIFPTLPHARVRQIAITLGPDWTGPAQVQVVILPEVNTIPVKEITQTFDLILKDDPPEEGAR